MRFPDILIIGAMKAGTTSLYMDLTQHERVFFTDDKEPHALCSDEVLTDEGRRRYADFYRRAEPNSLCCDASTAYTKRPDYDGIAERADQLLPDNYKAIYVVRHPIERIISQHHHEHTLGLVGPSIDDAVAEHARFVQYSSYAYQLRPWIDAIGMDRIAVVRFEDYVAKRQEVVADLFRFLGLDAEGYEVDSEKVYNRSVGKHAKNRFWNRIQGNELYRRWLRPLVPLSLRLKLYQWVLPSAPPRPDPPRPETIAHLRDALADDVSALTEVLGRDEPLWEDFNPNAAPSLG